MLGTMMDRQLTIDMIYEGIQALPIGFAFFDSQDRLVIYNDAYQRHFGFVPRQVPIEVAALRVEVTGRAGLLDGIRTGPAVPSARPAEPTAVVSTWFDEGERETPVYRRDDLAIDGELHGPSGRHGFR